MRSSNFKSIHRRVHITRAHSTLEGQIWRRGRRTRLVFKIRRATQIGPMLSECVNDNRPQICAYLFRWLTGLCDFCQGTQTPAVRKEGNTHWCKLQRHLFKQKSNRVKLKLRGFCLKFYSLARFSFPLSCLPAGVMSINYFQLRAFATAWLYSFSFFLLPERVCVLHSAEPGGSCYSSSSSSWKGSRDKCSFERAVREE